ncbi:hypothetical protein GCM10027060_26200 [Nesterenkonia halophila]|uniref:hypothetical protein n=1 Tax=Nesterenkonia halophila TaxID=302044 RepID=UPI001292B147|nr:hypothetical protein [Nesterenkonia halophila]
MNPSELTRLPARGRPRTVRAGLVLAVVVAVVADRIARALAGEDLLGAVLSISQVSARTEAAGPLLAAGTGALLRVLGWWPAWAEDGARAAAGPVLAAGAAMLGLTTPTGELLGAQLPLMLCLGVGAVGAWMFRGPDWKSVRSATARGALLLTGLGGLLGLALAVGIAQLSGASVGGDLLEAGNRVLLTVAAVGLGVGVPLRAPVRALRRRRSGDAAADEPAATATARAVGSLLLVAAAAGSATALLG